MKPLTRFEGNTSLYTSMHIFNNLAVRSVEAQCQNLRGSSFAVQIISPSWKFFVPRVSRVSFCDYIYEKSWLAGSIDFEFMLVEWWFCYLVRLYLNHCKDQDWTNIISRGISKKMYSLRKIWKIFNRSITPCDVVDIYFFLIPGLWSFTQSVRPHHYGIENYYGNG